MNIKHFTIIIIAFVGLKAFSPVKAQAIDHTFTYQGELIDNGTPANGLYDMAIQAFTTLSGSTTIGVPSNHQDGTPIPAITVTDGIFTIDNVNIGVNAFDGDAIWLEISVKKSSDIGANYVPLSPRQKLTAVPYASNLITNGAQTGQVLTFDGSQWLPATNSSSPWTVGGSTIYYNGNVGINNTSPTLADLIVDGTTDGDVFRARVDGQTKFRVDDNGGTGIGSGSTPPVDGLTVAGGSRLKGGAVIGSSSLSNIPAEGLVVQGGISVGLTLAAPTADGLIVGGDTTLRSNLQVNGNITSPDSGTADMKAYAYGFVNSDETILTYRSSTGFTVLRESVGQYKVSFTDTSINLNYIATATLNASSPKFVTVVDNSDFFRVYVWDKNGVASDHAFKFVVYRK